MTRVQRKSTFPGVFLLSILLLSVPSHSTAQESTAVSRRVLSKVAPNYPALAFKMDIQGSVKVEALVSANGSVKSVTVKGGHPLLAQAAQDAVRGWKWEVSAKETRELVEIKFDRQ